MTPTEKEIKFIEQKAELYYLETMTPKEKAKYLISINTLAILSVVGNKLTMDEVKEIAKQFTLSEVDEILKVVLFYNDSQAEVIYFKEVKQEIEKL